MLVLTFMKRFGYSFKVLIDNNIVGKVKNGEIFYLELQPGLYTLQIKVFFYLSKKHRLEIIDDKRIRYHIGKKFDLWYLFRRLIYVIYYLYIFLSKPNPIYLHVSILVVLIFMIEYIDVKSYYLPIQKK